MNMEFYGKIIFKDTEENKLECEWNCYHVDLPFIPSINSSILLPESSRIEYEDYEVESIGLFDKNSIIIFKDKIYTDLHDSIHIVLKEFKEGLNKWLNSHGCFSHIINIDKPKKEECKQLETILIEKYKKEMTKDWKNNELESTNKDEEYKDTLIEDKVIKTGYGFRQLK